MVDVPLRLTKEVDRRGNLKKNRLNKVRSVNEMQPDRDELRANNNV